MNNDFFCNFATKIDKTYYMKVKFLITLLLSFFCVNGFAQTTYKRKTNLPHVYIETFGRKAITSKVTYIYATMHYVDEEDVVTTYDSMQIRGRGNSTWGMAKKPYRIKFLNKEKFLGKGYANAKKWTLMANAGDKTLMRNAVTSLMGDFLGLKNNPARKFVDVTLNGVYIGNYQISDQVEVRPHRVNITEQDYPLTAESDITGGYLLEVDGFQDGNCFTTGTYAVPVRIHYPDDEEISSEQNTYIRNYIRQFESVLSSSSFDNPDNGYRSMVDTTSLLNWFIATEVSGNIDGYYSTYFYKDQNDPHLYWGPLWDYDIAYANDDRKGDTSRQLMTDVGYGQTRNWVNRMWEDAWFGKAVNRRYKEVVDAGLEDYMYNQIDSISALLAQSQELNYNKWGINRKMLRERVLYSSYEQYVVDLKNYIKIHIPYLKTAFANKKAPEPTPPFVAGNYWYRITNAKTGNALDTYKKSGLAGDLVCSWRNSEDVESQLWKIVPVGDYFMLINKVGDVALNDPTQGASTATTNTGTQLDVAVANPDDDRQLWTITPQGIEGYYNLTNKYSKHTANLNGGGAADGTSVLSYTTDSRNSSSTNRLWYIIADTEIETLEPDEPEEPDNPDEPDEPEEEPDAIASVEPAEYALAYNPTSHTLHFGSETPELLSFDVQVLSANGVIVKTFKANQNCSLADLPRAIYIIRWKVGGKTRTTKVML